MHKLKCKGMKLDHYFTSYGKINSKWIENLNVRPEILKLLEENVDGQLFEISLGDDFLYLTLKAKNNKSKINELRLHRTKKLLQRKGNQLNEKSARWLGGNICKSYI